MTENIDLTADLRGMDLRRRDLSGANLTGADLSRAKLRGADLTDANIPRPPASTENFHATPFCW